MNVSLPLVTVLWTVLLFLAPAYSSVIKEFQRVYRSVDISAITPVLFGFSPRPASAALP